ncbi:MAG: methionine gamma-lyase family protein [Caldisericia bacterium]
MNSKIREFIKSTELELQDVFETIDEIADHNLEKVITAFGLVGITSSDLAGSTGYGLGDISRDKLERVYSYIFGTESSLVRPQIASGTHAHTKIFGLLVSW